VARPLKSHTILVCFHSSNDFGSRQADNPDNLRESGFTSQTARLVCPTLLLRAHKPPGLGIDNLEVFSFMQPFDSGSDTSADTSIPCPKEPSARADRSCIHRLFPNLKTSSSYNGSLRPNRRAQPTQRSFRVHTPHCEDVDSHVFHKGEPREEMNTLFGGLRFRHMDSFMWSARRSFWTRAQRPWRRWVVPSLLCVVLFRPPR